MIFPLLARPPPHPPPRPGLNIDRCIGIFQRQTGIKIILQAGPEKHYSYNKQCNFLTEFRNISARGAAPDPKKCAVEVSAYVPALLVNFVSSQVKILIREPLSYLRKERL